MTKTQMMMTPAQEDDSDDSNDNSNDDDDDNDGTDDQENDDLYGDEAKTWSLPLPVTPNGNDEWNISLKGEANHQAKSESICE